MYHYPYRALFSSSPLPHLAQFGLASSAPAVITPARSLYASGAGGGSSYVVRKRRLMPRLTLPPEGVTSGSSYQQGHGMEPSSTSRSEPISEQASMPASRRLLLLCFPLSRDRRDGGGAGGGETRKMATSRGGLLPNSRSGGLALSPAGSSKHRDLLSVQLEVRLEGRENTAPELRHCRQ